MPPHLLTNFEIQKYQNEHKFKGDCSRDNLPKSNSVEIKNGACVINLDEYSDIGTDWIILYVLNNITCFHSFGVEHILKEIRTFIGNKNMKTNTFRIQAYDSVICGYFCIRFIDFVECSNIYPNLGVSLNATTLSDYQQFRLNKINEIKNYFLAEIK